jgi:thymidylate synthase (FAD)
MLCTAIFTMPINSRELEELRWKKFRVLDDGFVCLVDLMGDDQSVVQAARVSYGEGTKQVSDDRGLIRYLMRHRHTTPFEMAEIKAQRTPPEEWRTQAATNRQGSGDPLPESLGQQLTAEEAEFQDRARALYEQRIERGVAREQARKDLPLATYTEAYWKIDLHNLLHFLALRMDSHAQWEIRQYATTIGEQIVRPMFPLVWEAFIDYRMQALHLTRLDCELIQRLMQRLSATRKSLANDEDFLAVQDPSWAELKRCRERDECREKLIHLGLLK